jgi:hypothetical protein
VSSKGGVAVLVVMHTACFASVVHYLWHHFERVDPTNSRFPAAYLLSLAGMLCLTGLTHVIWQLTKPLLPSGGPPRWVHTLQWLCLSTCLSAMPMEATLH